MCNFKSFMVDEQGNIHYGGKNWNNERPFERVEVDYDTKEVYVFSGGSVIDTFDNERQYNKWESENGQYMTDDELILLAYFWKDVADGIEP